MSKEAESNHMKKELADVIFPRDLLVVEYNGIRLTDMDLAATFPHLIEYMHNVCPSMNPM